MGNFQTVCDSSCCSWGSHNSFHHTHFVEAENCGNQFSKVELLQYMRDRLHVQNGIKSCERDDRYGRNGRERCFAINSLFTDPGLLLANPSIFARPIISTNKPVYSLYLCSHIIDVSFTTDLLLLNHRF